MSDLLIRNLPDEIKKDIEVQAKKSGRSLSEQAKRLLAKALDAEKPKQGFGTMMHEAMGELDWSDDEHDKFWAEIEKDRKSDFGRPMPDYDK